MTVVYLDLLILLNFAANYMLLILAARMGGGVIKRGRVVVSACIGTAYAALCAMGVEWLACPLYKATVGVVMCLSAFGGKKGALRLIGIFFGVSAAFGGMIWAIELLGESKLTLENGILYSWIDIRLLLVLFVLCFALFEVMGERMFIHRKTELVSMKVSARGKTVYLKGLIDTGNTLTDPATNRSVLVIDGEACMPLLPMKLPLDRPIEALERLNKLGERGFRLIPYCAVGTSNGLMLAMQVECEFGEKGKRRTLLAALSPTKVSDGGGYQALIGGKEWI